MSKKNKVDKKRQEDPPKKICPPEIESTPIKAWTDENEKQRFVLGQSIQNEGMKAFNQLIGVKDTELANHLGTTGANAIKAAPTSKENLNVTLQVLHDLKPKDSMESSLILQASALFSHGMNYLKRADLAERFDQMQYYGNLAVKFLRLHNETIEAFNRYRRGGEQRVIIQHQQVTVSGQGQAVVGQFQDAGGGVQQKNKGDTPCQQYAEPKPGQTNISHVVNPQWQTADVDCTEERVQVQRPKKGCGE